jgi:hypothetical protein
MTTLSGQWTYGTHRVSKFADELMDRVVETFMTAGVPLPDRKFFTVGQPVHDCEELVVVFESVRKGLPGGEEEPANCDMPSTATFQIHLVRCFPVGSGTVPPTAAELTASADALMVDAWLLLQAVDELNRDPLTGLGGMVYSVSVGEPSGGYVGVVAQVEAMVP